MNEKNKCNTFLACSVLVLLVGLYYVIFIYDHNKNLEEIEDIEGSCNITECEEQEEISYILELEKIKTFEDNYLILPIISINDDSKNIQDINKQLEAKFKYYKDMYNKDNTSYLSTYEYNVDIDNNILSLVVHFCGNNEEDNYLCEFVIYNVDLNNNELLTNNELMSLYNINNLETDEINEEQLIYLNSSLQLEKIILSDDNNYQKELVS